MIRDTRALKSANGSEIPLEVEVLRDGTAIARYSERDVSYNDLADLCEELGLDEAELREAPGQVKPAAVPLPTEKELEEVEVRAAAAAARLSSAAAAKLSSVDVVQLISALRRARATIAAASYILHESHGAGARKLASAAGRARRLLDELVPPPQKKK